MMADPFTSAFKDPELMEKLAAVPEVRKHLADPGFVATLEQLRKVATDPTIDPTDIMQTAAVGQKIAQAGHKDPRVMQALMALQGQGLIIDEKDMKKAEDHGDMKRREPVQLREMQMVRDLTDADECKAKGNELFKAGDLNAAYAHYEKGVELLKAREEVPAAALATLLSNSALMLLKLKWPDRAKKSASMAIAVVRHAQDESFDQSKLFYRRSLAEEQMKDYAMALDDMLRALQQAKKSGLDAKELHRLKGEAERLKKLKGSQEQAFEKKKQEFVNERQAEGVRMKGVQLEEKQASASAATPNAEYLAEQDYTHWATKKVAEVVKGIMHHGDKGCRIEVLEFQEDKSKVETAITTKKGKRALYYEWDLTVSWKGKAAKSLKPASGPDEMQGVFRLYNIGHDTSFQLGGDENTSYIYQLGWDQRMTGPWVEDMRTEAAELFDLVSAKVDEVIAELKKK